MASKVAVVLLALVVPAIFGEEFNPNDVRKEIGIIFWCLFGSHRSMNEKSNKNQIRGMWDADLRFGWDTLIQDSSCILIASIMALEVDNRWFRQ